MLRKICLLLANNVCPATSTHNPHVTNRSPFGRPEKHYEDTTGAIVEYMRAKGSVLWNTNIDYMAFRDEFKMDQQPPMNVLFDYGAELMECYQSNDRLITLSHHTWGPMPDDVFLWLYEMSVGDNEIFRQFVDFYLNECHEELGGMKGSKAFSMLQTDQLRTLLDEEDLCRDVQTIAGTQMCVHAARYALGLNYAAQIKVLQKLLAREEIPGLPLEMSDDMLARFMRAVRVVLLKQ